jgi:hypothetical protein
VPSRQDEESPGGKVQLENELQVENQIPGVQSADEMIEDVETDQEKQAETKQPAER